MGGSGFFGLFLWWCVTWFCSATLKTLLVKGKINQNPWFAFLQGLFFWGGGWGVVDFLVCFCGGV